MLGTASASVRKVPPAVVASDAHSFHRVASCSPAL